MEDYLLLLLCVLGVSMGLGVRDFEEHCEPPKPILFDLNSEGQVSYGVRKYPYPTAEVPSRFYKDSQTQTEHEHRLKYEGYDQVNETQRCRSEKGLRCDSYTRTCRCFGVAGASWSYDRERCEFTQIGTFCSPSIGDYAHHCTEYAQCTCNWEHWDKRRWYPCDKPPTDDLHPLQGHRHDTNNGKCLCKPGYRPFDDNLGCEYSLASSINNYCVSRVLITVILISLNVICVKNFQSK